ncbi:MAG TPA: protein translocase subunit SecF, partial [Elusimicrobia bacterium]|nr:protein translocase subunit SecF [Elusimicrobiota bacterium]
MKFFKQTKIDFIGKRYIFFAISGGAILLGALSLILKGGPRLGIDFTGGTLTEIKFKELPPLEQLRKIFADQGISISELQSFPYRHSILIRTKLTSQDEAEIIGKLRESLIQNFDEKYFEIERSEYVGPAIGRHLVKRAGLAILFSLLGIVIYVAFRFKSGVWGTAGVLALAHDVFVTLGIFSLLNREVTILVISALLTLAGYSINDTIVIFDRMRENLHLRRNLSLGELINFSVNETLSRTVITSLTVFLILLALFFFGGKVIHDFSFALLFGVVVGSYSTIF